MSVLAVMFTRRPGSTSPVVAFIALWPSESLTPGPPTHTRITQQMDPSKQPLAIYGHAPPLLPSPPPISSSDKYDVRSLLDSIDLASYSRSTPVDSDLDSPPPPLPDDAYRGQEYESDALESLEECAGVDPSALHAERYFSYFALHPLPPASPPPPPPLAAAPPPPPQIDYSSYVPPSILSHPSFTKTLLVSPHLIPTPSSSSIMASAARRGRGNAQFLLKLRCMSDPRFDFLEPGSSFRWYWSLIQQHVEKEMGKEEEAAEEEEAAKKRKEDEEEAKEGLMGMLGGYGSSSSSDEGGNDGKSDDEEGEVQGESV